MADIAVKSQMTTKSQTEKGVSSPECEFPHFEIVKMEIPQSLRDAATNWLEQGKEQLEMAFVANEQMNGAFKSAYSTATKGAMEYDATIFDGVHTNTVAAFDLVRDILAAKSLPEAMEIANAGASKQFGDFSTKNLELWTLTQKVVNDVIKPMATGTSKIFDARSKN